MNPPLLTVPVYVNKVPRFINAAFLLPGYHKSPFGRSMPFLEL